MLSDTLIQTLRTRKALPTPAICRHIRISAGVSQELAAREVGVHRETISRWERGERRPSDQHLARYLTLLEELSKISAA